MSPSQTPRIFGTDGVRGTANRLLTPELALALGRAGAFVLADKAPAQSVVVGRDTRVSGAMLGAALAAGIMSVGLDVVDVGVLPTPGVALIARTLPAAAGIMVSASHNPFADNGIKFFGPDGVKLTDTVEDEIGALVAVKPAADEMPRPVGNGVGRQRDATADARDTYVRHVIGTVTARFDGIKVVIDCANGATTGLAREIFAELGASVTEIAAAPDGLNINERCGSTNPAALAAAVEKEGAALGLAFDGDGDRVIAADAAGGIVDGDGILAVCGLDLLKRGELAGGAVAATVMSNLGLDAALRERGGRVVRTPVGDRHVYAAMRQHGLALGGEQAGHIIFLAHNTTGDGLITGVQLLDTLVRKDQSLAEATADLVWYPQVQRSVRFAVRALPARVVALPATQAASRRIEGRLGAAGRLVLRPSGTEPLVRIMVEAADEGFARRLADELEEVVRAGADEVGGAYNET